MGSIGWMLLFFLAVLPALATTTSAHGDGNLTLRCHADQAATLLQLKKSFLFFKATTSLPSWQDGTDCCRWEGIGCDGYSGLVTVLDLNGRGLYSRGLDPVIFNLTSLQFLDLSMNDFGGLRTLKHLDGYNMPAVGFERLISLTHLNLSDSGMAGEIPIGINNLQNLFSLDLSNHDITHDDERNPVIYSLNYLSLHNLQTLVGNLSHLRKLYLDGVNMNGNEEWCSALAKYVPRLQELSLSGCGLYGPIQQCLSSLKSLTVINLGYNFISGGPFPEYFMDFVNLSVLQLADINLEGWFPRRIFQSENLRILDLSANDLSGDLPNFSNASSLETLTLDGTNFSYAKQSSFINFKSLKELALKIPTEFRSSFNMPVSLSQLRLTGSFFPRELGSILSSIGDQETLTSLELNFWDFSRTKPSSISNLKSLRSLSIESYAFTMPILSAIGNLKDLQSLYISCFGPTPLHLPSAIGNLTNLRSLVIYDCGFLGPVPSSIGKLMNLRSLNIERSDFLGPIPSTIGNLSKLKIVELVNCEFSGPIPSTIGNLSNLNIMEISNCEFPGPIPYAVRRLKGLTTLRLQGSGFAGEIPNSIGNLTRLLYLDLTMNHLSGKIPTSLFTLPVLRDLDLSQNQLTGPLHEFDMASSCLVSVDLHMNELTGQIPNSFFELTSLEYLDIGSNNLVGFVDLSSFWRLTKLRVLILSSNKLSVIDGEGNYSSSTYPSGLSWLDLVCCNLTKFPSILTHLDDVCYLDLSCNKVSGDIPNWIWKRWSNSLSSLNLSHNMFTGLQLNSYLLPSIRLDLLDLSFNSLQGQIPMPNSSATFLDYSHNNFSSVLPNFTLYLSNTMYLRMSNNCINGHLTHSVCDSELSVLDLSFNNFSGSIPSCLVEKLGLDVLNLRANHFQGTLPSNITSECTLQTIDLHSNKIEGQLPRALSNCSYLEVLDIGNNLVVDTFPFWLGVLPNLRVLILRSNRFYGSIGDVGNHRHQSREHFSSLQIIDVASNNFSGNLSSQWFRQLKSMMAKFNSTGDVVRAQNVSGPGGGFYQDSIVITYKGSSMLFERFLTTLTAIDFSNNSLGGTVSESVGRLISLRVLNMSRNAFTGKIPVKLGVMTDLESLDLSCNQLSGQIPEELTNLTFLTTLNLSDNQLVGKIPQSRQFLTFDNSSFEGNVGLCGMPLSNQCGVSPAPPSEAHVENSSHVDVVLFLFVGLGFGVGFATSILMRWGRIGEWFVKFSIALRT